jgi:XapX domain-containing protein
MAGGFSYPPWVGIAVAMLIGGLVRLLKLPIPAPPTIVGALMVLAMTVGYLLTNWLLHR